MAAADADDLIHQLAEEGEAEGLPDSLSAEVLAGRLQTDYWGFAITAKPSANLYILLQVASRSPDCLADTLCTCEGMSCIGEGFRSEGFRNAMRRQPCLCFYRLTTTVCVRFALWGVSTFWSRAKTRSLPSLHFCPSAHDQAGSNWCEKAEPYCNMHCGLSHPHAAVTPH